jgi:uncharacterized protein YjbI with pentapeptide repeats
LSFDGSSSRGDIPLNEQDDSLSINMDRPRNDDTEAWRIYLKSQEHHWRTEPEIDVERQKYLTERRSIHPDIEKGIYPFRDIQLTRADVEWLLATHENGRGPIYWSEVNQRDRWGLDLRGANLSQVNLLNLPLARLRGGLTWDEWLAATEEQRYLAGVRLVKANLFRTHLEGARLRKANFENAFLSSAHLEEAYLDGANLRRTILFRTHLEGASLREAHLENAVFYKAIFNTETNLEDVTKLDTALLADVHWGSVSLANLNWSQLNMLGDEYKARQKTNEENYFYADYQIYVSGKQLIPRLKKSKYTQLDDFMSAVRANRQLAVALQAQGLNEVAARFVYRSQLLQRKIFWYQRKFGQYLFSLFLDLLAGYGYRPGRSLIAYAVVITIFATIYHLLGTNLAWNEAIVISMTAFHGRGFFPEQFKPGDPQAMVAAIEAFVGLLIEVTFIATLTQRFFGK